MNADALDEDEEAGTRWAWVFWLLVLAAVVPWVSSVVAVAKVFGDDDLQVAYSGLRGPSIEFADRWSLATTTTDLGWTGLVGSLGVLVLAGAAVSGRPNWAVVPRGRFVLAVLAATGALWSAASITATVWVLRQEPTERQLAMVDNGTPLPTWLHWGTEGALTLAAVGVALAALFLSCSRPAAAGIESPATD